MILKMIYENSEWKKPSGEKGGKFSRWLVWAKFGWTLAALSPRDLRATQPRQTKHVRSLGGQRLL